MKTKYKVTIGLMAMGLTSTLLFGGPNITEAGQTSQTRNPNFCLAYASDTENMLELRGASCPFAEVNFSTLSQLDRQYTFPVEAVHRQPLNFDPFRNQMDLMSTARYEEIKDLLFNIDPHVSIIANYKTHLANKEFTVKEAYIFYLKLIEKYEFTNAILYLNPNMLQLAYELDKKIEADPNVINSYPLFGVPILVKDNIMTKYMPTTAGSVFLKDFVSEENAPVVQALEDAGAIIFGKTNLAEWSRSIAPLTANGYSALGGHVKNPYGRFDIQGSSSGSAFAASYFRMVTIGTDTSGSLIGPARQNSVATIKPTRNPSDINRNMIIPISFFYDNIGPMSQSVEDLARVLEVLYNDPSYTKLLDKNALQGVNVGFLNLTTDKDYLNTIGREIDIDAIQRQKALINELEENFKNAGSEVLTLTIHNEEDRLTNANQLPTYVANIVRYSFKNDLNQALETMFKHENVTLQDIINFNNTDTSLIPYGQATMLAANEIDLNNEEHKMVYEKSIKNSVDFTTRILDEMFKQVDVIVSIDGSLNNFYIASGYPIVSLPIGYNKETGEPRSMVLVGKPNKDAVLLSYAYAYEQHFTPRKSPNSNIVKELYKNRTAHVFINTVKNENNDTTGLLFNINGFNNKTYQDIYWTYELNVNGVLYHSTVKNYETDDTGNIIINFKDFTQKYIDINNDKLELYMVYDNAQEGFNFRINIWNNLIT